MARQDALPASLPPIGVCAAVAAASISVSVNTFLAMVAAGEMPRPRKARGRKVWIVEEVRAAALALPVDGEGGEDAPDAPNPWDE